MQKPTRSRHRPGSLTLRPRRSSVAEGIGWASGLLIGVIVSPAAAKSLLALLDAWLTTPPSRWSEPDALLVATIVLAFAGVVLVMKFGVSATLNIILNRERHRAAFASEFYAGPGLKGQPRLEP